MKKKIKDLTSEDKMKICKIHNCITCPLHCGDIIPDEYDVDEEEVEVDE